jgi:N-acyl-D-amino-acid deacylase
MAEVRDTIEAARARGVDVAADMYVYTAGGTGLEATIPSWAHEGGGDSLKARLASPEIRARFKRELVSGSPGWWNIVEAAGGWDGVVLANAAIRRAPGITAAASPTSRASRGRTPPTRRGIWWPRGAAA